MRTSLVLTFVAALLAAPVLYAKEPAAEVFQFPAGATAEDVDGKSYDLVVIGGTPGGIACAVRAAREGCGVLLVNHTQHLGGFMTSGAGGWEAPYDGLRCPLYAEMRNGAAEHYRKTYGDGSQQHLAALPSSKTNRHIDRAKVEPRVAEMLFERMVAGEPRLTVLKGYYVNAVDRDGATIRAATLRAMKGDRAVRVSGAMFADGMYEGDLLAAAKVPYRVGREARSEYDEPHAGVVHVRGREKQPGQKTFSRDADSGRLKIRTFPGSNDQVLVPQSTGEADRSVMAYNYRLVITRDPANRVPFPKPDDYDPAKVSRNPGMGVVPNLPNGKAAVNSLGRLVGPQNDYVEGDWATRERVSRQYLNAALGSVWYAQNDPNASQEVRERWKDWGLAKDEFPDNNNVPYEVYVREARRLVGRYVFTEHDNVRPPGLGRTPVHPDSVAITDWPVDSVACNKGSKDGVFMLTEDSRPAQVPYRTMLAQGVDNLLVPVALSATHVGWGAIRLEPVWMQTGEAAGFAAALAKKHKTTPAQLDSDLLLRALVGNHVMVSFFNDVDVTSDDPRVAAAQYFGTKGFFHDYDARLGESLKPATAKAWADGLAGLLKGELDPNALARAVADAEARASDADAGKTLTYAAFVSSLPSPPKGGSSKPDAAISRGEAIHLMFTLLP